MRARRCCTWGGLVAGLAGLALALPAGALGLGFQGPQYVDPGLAGGEPLVISDPAHGDLLYTSHEGTTHLYRPGLVTTEPAFETNYRDQVNMWTSKDDGASWQFVNYQGTGFSTNPSQNLGFSDPDLTMDAGGRIYNTGIDLANDALFSSADGGFTWDRGTVQCHDGDRPWLAAGRPNEVFMGTDVQEPSSGSGHEVFQSTDGGNTCSANGIPANGTLADGKTAWTGDGKIYYDRMRDKLVEPMVVSGADGGVGVDTWSRGDSAFKPGTLIKTTLFAHWPSISLDRAGNLYLVWDTDPRDTANPQGCSDQSPVGNGASGAPLPNQIMMAVSHDLGQTWSPPFAIANPGNARVLWPWVVAGDPGKVSVVWYQLSAVADPDCAPSDTHTYVMDANLSGADNPATTQETAVNAAARSIHEGGICQGGTTCVATGQDRRLGDFFTNQLDSRGCVMIATGDTERTDPITGGQLPTSLPTILRQSSGSPLVGSGDCSKNLPKASPESLSVSPGAVSATTTAQPGAARCPDRTAPVSRFGRRGVLLSRRRVVLSGTSHDTDVSCTPKRAHIAGQVARVRISIGREVNHARQCRYLKASGRFSAPRSCLRTSYLPARGTATWHFDFVGSFPPGRYQIWVRGLDPSNNIERKAQGRNFLHARIP